MIKTIYTCDYCGLTIGMKDFSSEDRTVMYNITPLNFSGFCHRPHCCSNCLGTIPKIIEKG